MPHLGEQTMAFLQRPESTVLGSTDSLDLVNSHHAQEDTLSARFIRHDRGPDKRADPTDRQTHC